MTFKSGRATIITMLRHSPFFTDIVPLLMPLSVYHGGTCMLRHRRLWKMGSREDSIYQFRASEGNRVISIELPRALRAQLEGGGEACKYDRISSLSRCGHTMKCHTVILFYA